MAQPTKLGILGSGTGSNLQAILDAIEQGSLFAEVVLVMSDQSEAYILERARRAGVAAVAIDCGGFKTKFPHDKQVVIAQQLKEAGVELVLLAGFMRLVGTPMLEAFPSRILNIHPSLLPAYPGLMAWEQAIKDGAAESGCTVHYVDAGMDTGGVLRQAKVPVLKGDTAETLHQRIQAEEHRIYPEVVAEWIANQCE